MRGYALYFGQMGLQCAPFAPCNCCLLPTAQCCLLPTAACCILLMCLTKKTHQQRIEDDEEPAQVDELWTAGRKLDQ